MDFIANIVKSCNNFIVSLYKIKLQCAYCNAIYYVDSNSSGINDVNYCTVQCVLNSLSIV